MCCIRHRPCSEVSGPHLPLNFHWACFVLCVNPLLLGFDGKTKRKPTVLEVPLILDAICPRFVTDVDGVFTKLRPQRVSKSGGAGSAFLTPRVPRPLPKFG